MLTERSIPAPAGEPNQRSSHLYLRRVYPRACGGTACLVFLLWKVIGLSPRLRGNLPGAGEVLSKFGSIPAPAGNLYH